VLTHRICTGARGCPSAGVPEPGRTQRQQRNTQQHANATYRYLELPSHTRKTQIGKRQKVRRNDAGVLLFISHKPTPYILYIDGPCKLQTKNQGALKKKRKEKRRMYVLFLPKISKKTRFVLVFLNLYSACHETPQNLIKGF
jgi:hypothetical protein